MTNTIPLSERAAYTPKEFAALFGKSQTWGYRMIYAQRVHVITSMGNQMIPATEVSRLLADAKPLTERTRKPPRHLRK